MHSRNHYEPPPLQLQPQKPFIIRDHHRSFAQVNRIIEAFPTIPCYLSLIRVS
jgi:hypothetical protein